ncbi:futalosine hydrolase [Alteribacter aurantiacus]|uniref:futalosine hydrolase n=1 Tax=Alteribacter aurantiacus TaxID=254410 RepID=UPI000402753D|nr:futalosine hydrolase [Alteribacter aurantiacus]
MTNILIVTSVEVEKAAVEKGLSEDPRFQVICGGVGVAAAAANTATALASGLYDLVINMGIGGGFKEVAKVGDLVVGTKSIAADLGAELPNGFIPIDELGFGSAVIEGDQEKGEILLHACNRNVHLGDVLTLNTVTGTEETANKLRTKHPKSLCEAMEGFGVATAAKEAGVPFLEVRAISNPVGPRDREAWKIKEALSRLTEASEVMKEVF